MNFQNLKTVISNHILTLTISRPEKLNALNQQTMDELSRCFEWIATDPQIKGIIVTGEGEKAFVAGADITEFLQMDAEIGRQLSKKGQDIFFQIENCTKPVLAAVNGFALGGGCELAMACHMRVASENAQFGQPEINLGIIPGYGGTQRLTQLVGKGKAIELMLTADRIDSQTALFLGLVNHVVPLHDLLPFAMQLMEKITAKSPIAVAMTLKAAHQAETKQGYASEVDSFSVCTGSADFREGATAFLEKRKPNFQGK